MTRKLLATVMTCCIGTGVCAAEMEDALSRYNSWLVSQGSKFIVGAAEYLTAAESGEVGRIVFFSDHGNKQMPFDWVPGDPRREWNQQLWGITGPDLSVIVDDVDLTVNADPENTLVPGVDDLAAYHNANATWDDVNSSSISIIDLGDSGGVDLGLVQWLEGLGGPPRVFPDVPHAGMLPSDFFDSLVCGIPGSGCGSTILGVTLTFIWFEGDDPTDIDNNGKLDTAFREIYYNENAPWADNPDDRPFDGTIDLHSVALHEMGHGLSQAHFGEGFFIDRNNNGVVPDSPREIVTAPRALMNAGHTRANRSITGTDKAGHCAIWADWPIN